VPEPDRAAGAIALPRIPLDYRSSLLDKDRRTTQR
jgi:hypothetical protein